jgi:glycosyl transferase family 25
MQAFVINLKKELNRREFQKAQLTKLGLTYNIVEAISTNDIENQTYKKHHHDWVRPLRRPELACYFSHKEIWKKIINSNEPALVLEDDALLSRHTKPLLDSLFSLTDVDLVNLEVRMRKKFLSRKKIKINNHFELLRLYQDRTGAAAYVLFPSGAKKLLECEYKKGVAIADAHITGCSGMKSYQVEPAAAVQLDICDLYKIDCKGLDQAANSSISIHKRDKGGIKFKLKRAVSQIRLGIRQVFLILISTRRYVKINKNEFNTNL